MRSARRGPRSDRLAPLGGDNPPSSPVIVVVSRRSWRPGVSRHRPMGDLPVRPNSRSCCPPYTGLGSRADRRGSSLWCYVRRLHQSLWLGRHRRPWPVACGARSWALLQPGAYVPDTLPWDAIECAHRTPTTRRVAPFDTTVHTSCSCTSPCPGCWWPPSLTGSSSTLRTVSASAICASSSSVRVVRFGRMLDRQLTSRRSHLKIVSCSSRPALALLIGASSRLPSRSSSLYTRCDWSARGRPVEPTPRR